MACCRARCITVGCRLRTQQEFMEQKKKIAEEEARLERERHEKERLLALKNKEKREQSAVASSEVKQKLQVRQPIVLTDTNTSNVSLLRVAHYSNGNKRYIFWGGLLLGGFIKLNRGKKTNRFSSIESRHCDLSNLFCSPVQNGTTMLEEGLRRVNGLHTVSWPLVKE